MKIKKISIKNYRSCIDTSFDLHPSLSVLIGPNGSGKTTILSAMRLLESLCNSTYLRTASSNEMTSDPAEIEVTYGIENYEIQYHAKVWLVTNERNQDEITSSYETWTVPSKSGRRKKMSVPSWMLHKQIFHQSDKFNRASSPGIDHFEKWLETNNIVREVRGLLEQIITFVAKSTYYSASQFTNPGSAPVSFEVESEQKRRIGISLHGHKKLLFDIYQEYLKKSETYREFMSIVGPEGVELIESLGFEEIKTSSSNYSVKTGGKVEKKEKTNLLVIPQIKISGDTLSPSQLSEGTFKTLALVFYIVTDNSSVLMIEEPEVCVHHGLLKTLVDLIEVYSNEKQILISTHSSAVLDRVEVENVFSVKRHKNKGTQVAGIKRRMKSRQLRALSNFLETEGSLGEYWKHGDLETI